MDEIVPTSVPARSGYTPPRREILWLKEGKKCHWCGQPTRLSNDGAWDMATTEHVIPRVEGGTSDDSNLVSACNRCNNRRSHEYQLGLPDGHLLGQYKNGHTPKKPVTSSNGRIVLTGDEKKALMAKMTLNGAAKKSEIDVVRESRDQALRTIDSLRAELYGRDEEIKVLRNKIATMTIRQVLRRRLIAFFNRQAWLTPEP